MPDVHCVLDDIHCGSGRRQKVVQFDVAQWLDGVQIKADATESCIMFVYWPRSLSYLSVDLSVFEVGAAQGMPFSTGQTAVDFALRSGAMQARDADSVHLYAMQLRLNARVEGTLTVDTDHPDFLARARGRQGAELSDALSLFAIAQRAAGAPVLRSSVKLRLVYSPAGEMSPCRGFAALDFGNTSSSLAYTSQQTQDLGAIRLVRSDRPGWGGNPPRGTVQSALWVEGPRTEEGGFAKYSKSEIGESVVAQAGKNSAGWLALGSKRLLSEAAAGAKNDDCRILLGGAPVSTRRRELAEVFLERMFRGFHNHEGSLPRPLAVTCPTTFSDWEVTQLREALGQAYLRSENHARRKLSREQLEEWIPRVIDEASAAAFYFVYHDFLAGPGRLPALRYLYPQGMNMLIYDCGGGTTDISLVHLRTNVASNDPGVNQVELKVLGRTGHRTFGGDFITESVFRLAKWKLAPLFDGPDAESDLKSLEANLKRFAPEVDRVLPTQFDPANLSGGIAQKRMAATLGLWKVAEDIKHALSRPGTKTAPIPEAKAHLALKELGLDLYAAKKAKNRLELPTISRAEVDVLIGGEVDRTIRYSNDLLDACLYSAPPPEPTPPPIPGRRSDPGPRSARGTGRSTAPTVPSPAAGGSSPPLPPDLHWVYVIGNASLYPLIRDRLGDSERGLRVRFLKNRMREVPQEELKNSVAKGALIALRMKESLEGVQVVWDERIMQRLPYDITHRDLGKGLDTVLFPQHVLYSELKPASVEVPTDDQKHPVTKLVVLGRKWPGESKSEAFLRFDFKEPIAGRYAIAYDPEEHKFIMHPEGKGGGREASVAATPFDPPPYLPPPQSGRL